MLSNKKGDDSFAITRNVPSFAVVAKINRVVRPALRIAVHPLEEGVELDYEPSDTFLAVGVCIDLSYVGDSYILAR